MVQLEVKMYLFWKQCVWERLNFLYSDGWINRVLSHTRTQARTHTRTHTPLAFRDWITLSPTHFSLPRLSLVFPSGGLLKKEASCTFHFCFRRDIHNVVIHFPKHQPTDVLERDEFAHVNSNLGMCQFDPQIPQFSVLVPRVTEVQGE